MADSSRLQAFRLALRRRSSTAAAGAAAFRNDDPTLNQQPSQSQRAYVAPSAPKVPRKPLPQGDTWPSLVQTSTSRRQVDSVCLLSPLPVPSVRSSYAESAPPSPAASSVYSERGDASSPATSVTSGNGRSQDVEPPASVHADTGQTNAPSRNTKSAHDQASDARCVDFGTPSQNLLESPASKAALAASSAPSAAPAPAPAAQAPARAQSVKHTAKSTNQVLPRSNTLSHPQNSSRGISIQTRDAVAPCGYTQSSTRPSRAKPVTTTTVDSEFSSSRRENNNAIFETLFTSLALTSPSHGSPIHAVSKASSTSPHRLVGKDRSLNFPTPISTSKDKVETDCTLHTHKIPQTSRYVIDCATPLLGRVSGEVEWCVVDSIDITEIVSNLAMMCLSAKERDDQKLLKTRFDDLERDTGVNFLALARDCISSTALHYPSDSSNTTTIRTAIDQLGTLTNILLILRTAHENIFTLSVSAYSGNWQIRWVSDALMRESGSEGIAIGLKPSGAQILHELGCRLVSLSSSSTSTSADDRRGERGCVRETEVGSRVNRQGSKRQGNDAKTGVQRQASVKYTTPPTAPPARPLPEPPSPSSPRFATRSRSIRSHSLREGAEEQSRYRDAPEEVGKIEPFAMRVRWGIEPVEKWLYCIPIFRVEDLANSHPHSHSSAAATATTQTRQLKEPHVDRWICYLLDVDTLHPWT